MGRKIPFNKRCYGAKRRTLGDAGESKLTGRDVMNPVSNSCCRGICNRSNMILIFFSEGLADVTLNNKYGYIDKDGQVKIPKKSSIQMVSIVG